MAERAVDRSRRRQRPPRPPFWIVFAENPPRFAAFLFLLALVAYRLFGGEGALQWMLMGAVAVCFVAGEVYEWWTNRQGR